MGRPEDELKSYDQLCQSYRAIDDFRSKLLGALPVVSGVGLFSMGKNLETASEASLEARHVYSAVGAFGALITAGLFAYEIYAIKKCAALISAGKKIEAECNLANGQFVCRPQNIGGIVNEPFASGVIYPAVLAAWTYFALAFSWPTANPGIPLAVLFVGFVGTLAYDRHLRRIYSEANQTGEKERAKAQG
jgi:hypothetical protein